MHSYLEETKYASSELIKLISYEDLQLNELSERLVESEVELKEKYNAYQESEMNIQDNMIDMELKDAYYGFICSASENAELVNRINKTKAKLQAKYFSICSLSGALLQIAKQGISSVHVSLTYSPDGRAIGNETLKNVIWQARNQSNPCIMKKVTINKLEDVSLN